MVLELRSEEGHQEVYPTALPGPKVHKPSTARCTARAIHCTDRHPSIAMEAFLDFFIPARGYCSLGCDKCSYSVVLPNCQRPDEASLSFDDVLIKNCVLTTDDH